jgi:very-short-patch-repair endonuclease
MSWAYNRYQEFNTSPDKTHASINITSLAKLAAFDSLELQKMFAGTSVKADTADKFQGQERNVMIFSTVDNEIGEFASDPNRLNVAVSRAIDQFIVVTDGNDNDRTSPIHDLIGYIRYHNHEIFNSDTHSVFDFLYQSYAEAREDIMRKYGKVSEVDSENLMYVVIRDVLSKSDYSKYDVVMHVPLRMILSDLTKLNTRELSFATNHLTHVDFLIFSRLTHQPILVVEVDGFAYHNSEKQRERDQVKNAILEKYNVPILRLSTVGSGEKQKLIPALESMNVT